MTVVAAAAQSFVQLLCLCLLWSASIVNKYWCEQVPGDGNYNRSNIMPVNYNRSDIMPVKQLSRSQAVVTACGEVL